MTMKKGRDEEMRVEKSSAFARGFGGQVGENGEQAVENCYSKVKFQAKNRPRM